MNDIGRTAREPRRRPHQSRAWQPLARPVLLGLAAAFLFGAVPASVAAQSPSADSARIARLASLGQLWVAIREFHPWLGYRPIAWDSALAATVPRVSAAPDRTAFAAAVADMVAALGDPVTRLEPDSAPAAARSQGEPDPRSWWAADSVLVVALRNPADFGDFDRTIARLTAIADTIRRARRVVFDLRSPVSGAGFDWALGESGIPSLFAPAPARAPDQRGRLHAGVPPEVGNTSGGGPGAHRRRRRHERRGRGADLPVDHARAPPRLHPPDRAAAGRGTAGLARG